MVYRRVRELVVSIWGREVGVLYPNPTAPGRCLFEYNPEWVRGGIDLAPLTMRFRAADPQGPPADSTDEDRGTWHGVPALLADSVPDDFGNRVIDAALAREGVAADDVTALDRLAYVGARGMGALTYDPARAPAYEPTALEMRHLVEEAREVIHGNFGEDSRRDSLRDIIQTGTSAGGARAKAVIAWDRETNEVRPGNVVIPSVPGERAGRFEQWLVKFDGVRKGDYHLADPEGYTRVEFAYSQMARAAGIEIAETTLMHEGPRAHFMTRRFDRPGTDGKRLHMQTLNGLAAMNYKYEGVHAYESLVTAMQSIGAAGPDALEQVFRRAVFNVLASNNDDHTKNIAFLMDTDGVWHLAPAYDVTFAYQAGHRYIGQHFMSINGKFSGVTVADLRQFGNAPGWQVPGIEDNIERVADAVAGFGKHAEEAGVPAVLRETVQHRIDEIFAQTGVLRR